MINRELHKSIRNSIKSGDVDGITAILKANPEAVTMDTPFGTWLHVAASFGRLEIVKLLVERFGLDFNTKGGVAQASALHRAAAEGQLEIVKYLLDCGSVMDLSAPERNPLFGAILGGNIDIGKSLIEHGIDAKVRYSGESMYNMDACEFARERGATEFVELLTRKDVG